MYATKYQVGYEIQSTVGKSRSRVVDSQGTIVHEGKDIDCVRWLAERGDKIAQRELAARKDR